MPSPAALAKLTPLIVLAVCLTALAMMVMNHRDSRYKPLFGTQEAIGVSDMMTLLEAERIPYRIHPDSGQVLVPENQLGSTRMLLAAKGVVAKLPAGLEQVDRSDPLGVSQFVQDVRFRRGLEGELVQSIMTLEPVSSARVHLSISRSSSFILADGDKSSASVVLALKPGRQLTKEQISAIVALVAGSVANLDPARVTVVDQAGAHLSAQIDPASPAGAFDEAFGARVRDETLRNIQELLAPTLGHDNFRASVTAEIDQDRVEETREQYGDAPKVTQEATREEQDGAQTALGVPGSLSNRPVPPAAASGAVADSARAGKHAQTRQYAYDRSVVQIKRSPARLKRLNVAVVINNAVAPAGAKAWTPEQLERIDAILRNGLGIDADRDDALVVSALDFRAAPAVEQTPWWKQPDNVLLMGTWGAYVIGALALFLFVLRPLIKILRQWSPVAHAVPARVPLDADAARTLPADDAGPRLPAGKSLPPVGSDVDVLVDHLKHLAGEEPERVAEVIKPWIRKHA
ncbi:flagellar MS-ring protein [Burkholderia ubonensis]|nr:flagellar MS-ring protein [Burkholderia ubonensis]KVZ57338.1 flagellar MS-ring protein [Burkholderia ubonensis]KVZ73036.1 flagellar MS-ring protein [Burkholderia ubonensis]